MYSHSSFAFQSSRHREGLDRESSGWPVHDVDPDPGDGVIAGHHELGIRALDPEPVAKEEESTPDPETATGKQFMEDRLQQRKDRSLSRRKNRAKEDAPTASFGGKVDRFRASQDLANPEKPGNRVQINRGSNRVDVDITEDGTVEVTQ